MTAIRCEVGAVRSSLVDPPADADRALREALSVAGKGAWFARRSRPGWDGRTKFYSAAGAFYTGLLPRVADVVESLGHELRLVDRRAPEPPRRLPAEARIEARGYQAEIVDLVAGLDGCTVKAATNSGKTVIAAALAARWGSRVLFVVPTVELCEQTRDVFARAFPASRVAALWERGGRVVDEGADRADVVVANVQGLAAKCRRRFPQPKRRPDGTRYEGWRYGPLHAAGRAFLARFGVLFGDEVHLLSSDEWSKVLAACPARRRVALSATPDASGDPRREWLRVGLFGEVVAEVSQAFLRDEGHSVPVTVRLLDYAPGPPLPAAWGAQYRRGVVACDARNEAFARRIVADASAGLRCLVLVERYEHAERIAELLPEYTSRRLVPAHAFAFGTNRAVRPEALAAFRSGRAPVLFATRVLGTGVDIKEIDRLFVAAAGGAEEAVSVQRGGRLVRFREGKEAVLYDARDERLRWDASVPPAKRHLERHFRKRVRAYAGEGFRVER